MDPAVVAALIGMGALTLTAVIAGTFGLVQSKATAGHVKDIKSDTRQLRPNGGSSVFDLVTRVAASQIALQESVQHVVSEQQEVRTDLAAQQQLVRDELASFRDATTADKEKAQEESIRMWRAIEAVAKAEPPIG